jgi:D-beta-D-heptose 7-phosphate kinase/D-beta-D-heptose 1-phosphate adenosyltransferase
MLGRLAEAVRKLGSPRVYVAGDLMLDTYLWGSVQRVSPEAPVQILNVQKEEQRAGGAANVARNLATLGAAVTCAGVVGRDESGRRLAALLGGIGVKARFVVDGARPTPVKTRMIAHNQQMLRVDREKAEPLAPRVEQAMASAAAKAAASHDAAVLSDYHKGTLTPKVCQAAIRAFASKGRPVLVGLKSRDHRKVRGATGASLNRSELHHLSGSEEVEKGAAKLLKELALKFLVVTLGERGLMVVERGGSFRLPAAARQVYDVTGAGDTVLSAFAIGVGSGLGLEECAQLANAAAGIVVGKVGTATVSRQELLDEAAAAHGTAHRKLVGDRELARAIAEERARGRKIVFTNGCFDLLHPGHVRVLEFAKSKGEVLVVAINTDRSVKGLKGPGRPVMNERERAAMLGALEAVDYVVLFGDATPERLLKLLRPDVLVKGESYGREGVVGREFVESYGGRVELAPMEKGVSTTGILERLGKTR